MMLLTQTLGPYRLQRTILRKIPIGLRTISSLQCESTVRTTFWLATAIDENLEQWS